MTSMTNLKLSMNELVATRSIRFVVARYSTRKTEPGAAFPSSPDVVENSRLTRDDSSLSTPIAFWAMEARRAFGKGMFRTLEKRVSRYRDTWLEEVGYEIEDVHERPETAIRRGWQFFSVQGIGMRGL